MINNKKIILDDNSPESKIIAQNLINEINETLLMSKKRRDEIIYGEYDFKDSPKLYTSILDALVINGLPNGYQDCAPTLPFSKGLKKALKIHI